MIRNGQLLLIIEKKTNQKGTSGPPRKTEKQQTIETSLKTCVLISVELLDIIGW